MAHERIAYPSVIRINGRDTYEIETYPSRRLRTGEILRISKGNGDTLIVQSIAGSFKSRSGNEGAFIFAANAIERYIQKNGTCFVPLLEQMNNSEYRVYVAKKIKKNYQQ